MEEFHCLIYKVFRVVQYELVYLKTVILKRAPENNYSSTYR